LHKAKTGVEEKSKKVVEVVEEGLSLLFFQQELILRCVGKNINIYSCGHAKPASLLAGEEFFLASNRLQIRICSPSKGPKPVESYFLGAFWGAAKFWAQILYLLPPCTIYWPLLELRELS
jgi:hypothetical protein